jgi:C4-dicarboxylate-specific signal transduction histidine kinase
VNSAACSSLLRNAGMNAGLELKLDTRYQPSADSARMEQVLVNLIHNAVVTPPWVW